MRGGETGGCCWKVGLVATLAQIGGCNGNFNFPANHALGHGLNPRALVGILLVVGVVLLVLGLVFFYVSSRLQFVLFAMVLRRETKVAPLWREFGGVTWRWIGLKLLFFFGAMVCLAPVVTPVVISLIRTVPASGQEPHNFAAFFATLAGAVLLIFAFAAGVCRGLFSVAGFWIALAGA